MRATLVSLTIASVLAVSTSARAIPVGQIDTFQSGTTENWVAGGGPFAQTPPVPPHVVLSGGPGGVNDAFLMLTSQGGNGPGSRLTAFNIFGQWADNYLTNGVAAIAMDLKNFGPTALTIRLEFENPFAGGDEAITNAGIVLNPGTDWVHALFPIGLGDLTAIEGSVAGALGNTSVLRIIHATGLTDAEPIAGLLGVDNIAARATIAAVPEPATIYMTIAALVLMVGLRRNQTSRSSRLVVDKPV